MTHVLPCSVHGTNFCNDMQIFFSVREKITGELHPDLLYITLYNITFYLEHTLISYFVYK
jgi:hypothetical protein